MNADIKISEPILWALIIPCGIVAGVVLMICLFVVTTWKFIVK